MRLFIFDDDQVRERVAASLADVGAEVSGSDDFDLALQTCYGERFDLLLVAVGERSLGLPLLEKLRGSGSRTPVILLSSDMRRATMTAALKLGIGSVVMKPLDFGELRGRILKAVPHAVGSGATRPVALDPAPAVARPAPMPAPAPQPEAAPPPEEAPREGAAPSPAGAANPDDAAADLLLVMNDRESVEELRAFLPAGVHAHGAWDLPALEARCQGAAYRLIVADATFGHQRQLDLAGLLRDRLPQAALVAVYARSKADRTDEAHRAGYHGFLDRPYDRAALHECLFLRLGWSELVAVEGNVLRPRAFPARSDKLERYFTLVTDRVVAAIDAIASACEDSVIVDWSELPLHSALSPELVAEVERQAQDRGLTLRSVASPGLLALVKSAPGTRGFQAYATLAEAV